MSGTKNRLHSGNYESWVKNEAKAFPGGKLSQPLIRG